MKMLIPGLLLGAANLFAQNALWIDLSGEWRALAGQDRPEFAAPNFDDSQWETVNLPTGTRWPSARWQGWIRKKVELPQGTDHTQLALTLGTIANRYEVYINGIRIGSTGSFTSIVDGQISRPRTFPVPAEAFAWQASRQASRNDVLVAIRMGPAITMHPVWRLPDRGPYLLTYLAQAPVDAGPRAIDRHRLENAPALISVVVFLGIAVLSFLGWLGERRRTELLWFTFMALARALQWLSLLSQLNPSSHPFRPEPIFFDRVIDSLPFPAFGEVVLNALAYRSPWPRWALWLGWAVFPVMFLMENWNARYFFAVNLWCTLLPLAAILWDWRPGRARRPSWGEHALRLALILPLLQSLDYWIGELRQQPSLVPGFFLLAGYQVDTFDAFWMIVCAAILVLLVRRVAADRAEKQRLTGELEAARVIQQLLLRSPALRQPELTLDAVYQPAAEVGGDFYYLLDGELVVIGDVAGKGLKAAMVVSLMIGVLNGIAGRRPTAVLAALNRAVTGQNLGGFVTCCCARFDADGIVSIANAGHLSPYLDGKEATLRPGLPLGLDANACFEEDTLRIAPGGRLTLVSDGVVEAANSKGELFGFDRTTVISTKSAREIAEAARAWGQNDDITVVTVRRMV